MTTPSWDRFTTALTNLTIASGAANEGTGRTVRVDVDDLRETHLWFDRASAYLNSALFEQYRMARFVVAGYANNNGVAQRVLRGTAEVVMARADLADWIDLLHAAHRVARPDVAGVAA